MDLSAELQVIHQPARLKIMGLLYKHRDVAYTAARQALALTDGNLSSHAERLRQAGFLAARRVLTRGGFELRYRITPEGVAAFREYLAALGRFLAEVGGDGEAADL